ncbi:PglL family O-oligosaccharyltransferase [Caldimonas brevitalea]|uniref:Lipid A core-O-antigen ligase n=1 Tax=Caldimonas brevitalea TaxID=413882 RepID=A0A0G3BFS2_9BURK|nr:O-antigen ligase family protein [Caldimonas brevitalea]AKJ26788.1 lipid A core - O-antigen ligase [Caldimonas brevitalea]
MPSLNRLPWPYLLAIAAPTWVAASRAPSTVFYNAIFSVAGMGLLLWHLAAVGSGPLSRARTDGVTRQPPQPLATAALPALAGVLIGTVLPGLLPASVLLAVSALALTVAAASSARRCPDVLMTSIAAAVLAAGVTGALIGLLQYLAPTLAPPWLIATPATAGRAVGNLRQPNQLATVLSLALCALAWLGQGRRWPLTALLSLQAVLVLGLVLTGSRMGLLMLVMLAAWGLVDRRLPWPVRITLMATLPAAVFWTAAVWAWGHLGGVVYFGEARLSSGSDISSSRFAIWSNTLALIRDNPWTGVGWGNFNFAWTLTAFPDRPIAFFDHTHNLVLQLAVELGLPATAALVVLFGWLVWRARRGLVHPHPQHALSSTTAAAMLGLVLVHSLLEYPLWYPYFLLPTALLLGVYLGAGGPRHEELDGQPHDRGVKAPLFRMVAAMMVAGAAYAAWSYEPIVQIFAPHGAAGLRPLTERIRLGQRSPLLGHHADYAAVTTASRPSDVFDAFDRPLHKLIDARLMVAYAKALAERGERDKAVYVAQRLREFRHPLGDEFFAPCEAPPAAGSDPPFQCDLTPVRLTWKDFE